MGDVSDGNGYMKRHTLYQHDWDSNISDASSGNGFINSHTTVRRQMGMLRMVMLVVDMVI